VEGNTDKAKLFQYSNKNTIVLKTNIYNNFRFPNLGKDYREHRLNEAKNKRLIKAGFFQPIT
jgi:5S rRNA maturation endonuclease (ribonuclease M5)